MSEEQVKKRRGRPKGSVNKNKKPPLDLGNVELPVFGEIDLIIPELLAYQTPTGKWKLVNPKTQERNLATRGGTESVNLIRKPVNDAVVISNTKEEIPFASFSKTDRGKIDKHFEEVSKHKGQSPSNIPASSTIKQKERGRPETLPKNIAVHKERGTRPGHSKNKKKKKEVDLSKPIDFGDSDDDDDAPSPKPKTPRPKTPRTPTPRPQPRGSPLPALRMPTNEEMGFDSDGNDLETPPPTLAELKIQRRKIQDMAKATNKITEKEKYKKLKIDFKRIDDAIKALEARQATPTPPTPRQATPRQPTPRQPTPRQPTPRQPTPRQPTPRPPTPRQPTPRPPTPRQPTPRPPTATTNEEEQSTPAKKQRGRPIKYTTDDERNAQSKAQKKASASEIYRRSLSQEARDKYDAKQAKKQGKGLVDFLKNGIKSVKGVVNTAKALVYGRNDYPPTVRNLLDQVKDKVINSIKIVRTPLSPVLTGTLNTLSLGQFKKNMKGEPYDRLFHLAMVFTADRENYLLEKNEVIHFVRGATIPKGESVDVSPVPNGLTIGAMLEATQKQMGDKFFSYSAIQNNCQDFILNIISANNIGTDATKNFVKQNVNDVLKNSPLTQKFTNAITNIGEKFNILTQGAGVDGIHIDINSHNGKNYKMEGDGLGENKISGKSITMPRQKLVKGSKEARDFMAKMRAMRGGKKKTTGGAMMCPVPEDEESPSSSSSDEEEEGEGLRRRRRKKKVVEMPMSMEGNGVRVVHHHHHHHHTGGMGLYGGEI